MSGMFRGLGRILVGGKWWQRLILVVVLLTLVVVAVVLIRRPPPVRSAPMQARLELAAGDVQVEQGGSGFPAFSGAALLPGSRIRTAPGARALIRLSDGSALFLRGGSAVELDRDNVGLLGGEVWLDAPPSERNGIVHQVGETSVFAADSGLSIRKTGQGAAVYVARGLATVTAPGGRVEVHAGEQAVVDGTAAPKTSPVAFWEDWTGGMADHRVVGSLAGSGTGQIFGVDPQASPGTPAQKLEIARQAVRAVLRGGLAETEVDQTFFNPTDRSVEGWYWFTIPDNASVTGFAVDTDGVLVEGEFIERREAAAQYERAAATGHEPALLEWIDSHTFRARIFPVPASGFRRVVLRYLQMLPWNDGTLRYTYPLQTPEPVRIGEFSLTVDLGAEGKGLELNTLADARVEEGGRLITMRRSGYTPRADFQLEARLGSKVPALRLSRFAAGGETADYIMARFIPDIDWQKAKQPRGEIVLVVDTSAGGDEASRVLKTTAAQAILRALSAEDKFALLSLDVRPTVLHPQEGLAPASEDEIDGALKHLAEHASGGATDLGSLFDVALARLHGAEQPAVIYVGDGVATSGETSGEALTERLRRALSTSRARLFTVGVGPHANRTLLSALASVGGGQAFQVDNAEGATERALRLVAALKTPTITDFEMDLGAGLDEVFESANGKVVRGDEVVVLARTHHDLPPLVKVKGRLGGESFTHEYPVTPDQTLAAAFVPKLWAAEVLRRLLGTVQDPESLRGKIMQLGIEYGLMTPYTSILALESEQAYQQQGIPRRQGALRGVRLSQLSPQQERVLVASLLQITTDLMGFGCSKESAPGQPVAGASSPATQSAADSAVRRKDVQAFGGASKSQIPSVPTAAAVVPGSGVFPKEESADTAKPMVGAAGMMAAKRPGVKAGNLDQPAGVRLEPVLQVCSDAARRSLLERVILWRKRLRTAQGPQELLARYLAARQSCELPDWQSEATFLILLQPYLKDEGAVSTLLSFFGREPETQRYLARLILRRTVDPRIIAVVENVLFGNQVNWATVDAELSQVKEPAQRLAKLRQILARSPDDPNGLIRLVHLLVSNHEFDEALVQGRRLRDAGLTTPFLARELGDVLARQKLDDEAVRTYSEIVEFDPESLPSRELLGDVYLAHGWYGPAYRQYKALTEIDSKEPLFSLRLAAAAAGAGRVDEALRLERQVASTPGRPGPSDVRRWAELLSASRLTRLLVSPAKAAPDADPKKLVEGMKTRLKELQLFRGPGTWVLLTWEDLSVDLSLVTEKAGAQVAAGQAVDAAPTGLSAVLLSPGDRAEVDLRVYLRSPLPKHPISFQRQEILWDGSDFKVSVKDFTLPEGETHIEL